MAQHRGLKRFYKMTGSGNDFVVFNAADGQVSEIENPETIRILSARGTGIGADGVVFLEKAPGGDVRMRYYNSDGSEAALCGNASLCSTNLAVTLGLAQAGGFVLHTAAGSLPARIRDGLPEVDLEPVSQVRPDASDLGAKPGEARLGYALAGVPHVVVEIEEIEAADVTGRGAELRNHPALDNGANVNFVARRADGTFTYRTFERGVEAETLACGTGAVATAIMLSSWGESTQETTLWTRSGLPLVVTLRRQGQAWLASLRGEGRIVFEGMLRDID
ncbi:MAG: diaminopimelate epimerase [Gemmatimonadaceae bacterium]|jgi:diaminopimelate epimerase|nr:diaminopimelate epimerase [Gemmatimonadaceae bacterium]